jgi:hypothetical protein
MAYEIYKVTSPAGRSYIGCTRKGAAFRWHQHEGCSRDWPGDERASIGDAINRYGKESFTLEVLATATSAADASAIETLMMERHRTLRPHGYNRIKSHYALVSRDEAA